MRTADLPHQVFSFHLYIRMIGEYQAHLATLDREIDALVHNIEACQLIQTIPGIGAVAGTTMAEIGEIARFDDARKLVAFADVDPSVHESGQFKATVNRITKRGSSRLRHALFVAAMCGLRASGSKRMQAFSQAKRAAGGSVCRRSVVQSFSTPRTFQIRKISVVYPTYCNYKPKRNSPAALDKLLAGFVSAAPPSNPNRRSPASGHFGDLSSRPHHHPDAAGEMSRPTGQPPR